MSRKAADVCCDNQHHYYCIRASQMFQMMLTMFECSPDCYNNGTRRYSSLVAEDPRKCAGNLFVTYGPKY